MSFMDAFTPEDRVQLKVTDLFTLMKAASKAELFMNGAINHVPHEYMIAIMSGKSDDLKDYEALGSIDEIKNCQAEYQRMCETVKTLQKENENLAGKVLDAETKIDELTATIESAPCETVDASEPTPSTDESLETDTPPHQKRVNDAK